MPVRFVPPAASFNCLPTTQADGTDKDNISFVVKIKPHLG